MSLWMRVKNCRDRIVLWFDQNSHAMQCNATLWRKTVKTFCHQSATISSECTVLLMSGLDLVIKTCFNVQFCFRCGIWSQSWLTCFTFVFLKSKHIFQKVFFPNNYVDVRHTPMLGKPTCKSNYGSEDKHPNISLVVVQVRFFWKSFLSKLLPTKITNAPATVSAEMLLPTDVLSAPSFDMLDLPAGKSCLFYPPMFSMYNLHHHDVKVVVIWNEYLADSDPPPSVFIHTI